MNIEQDKQLDAALAKLPRNIEPQRDLWPSISARIAQHRPLHQRRIWNYGLAAAAAVVIAIATTWVSINMHVPASGNDFATTVPPTNSTPVEPTDLHAQFTAQLASDINMPPLARKALIDSLRLIHDAIARTQLAVKRYPDDVNLQALLLDLYQQEARLMDEAQQAQIQTTVRTTL